MSDGTVPSIFPPTWWSGVWYRGSYSYQYHGTDRLWSVAKEAAATAGTGEISSRCLKWQCSEKQRSAFLEVLLCRNPRKACKKKNLFVLTCKLCVRTFTWTLIFKMIITGVSVWPIWWSSFIFATDKIRLLNDSKWETKVNFIYLSNVDLEVVTHIAAAFSITLS